MRGLLALGVSLALLAVAGCGQNVGSTPDETWKLSRENTKEIVKILDTVKDDATADVALPKLDSAVERQNALTKKLDSYTMSMDEWGKLVKDNMGDAMKSSFELAGAMVKATKNAPSRAEKFQTVFKKLEKSKKGAEK